MWHQSGRLSLIAKRWRLTEVRYKWNIRSELLLLVIGLSALVLGVLIYIATRPYQQILFLQYLPPMHISLPFQPVAIVQSLPSFLHIYGFILLTATVTPKRIDYLRLICVFWLVLEFLFEIGQQHDIALLIANHLPAWFYDGSWLLKVIPNYFIYGTFDPMDVVCLLVGAVAAYGTLVFTKKYST